MSRWYGRSMWFEPAPKLPPPARGIKMKNAGATWWGQRWIDALVSLSGGNSSRLSRGRSYARAGRTHDLVVKPGQVTARVTGSRPTPYKVTIALPKLSDAIWAKAIAAMAAKAQFAADLLGGEMPKEIDEAFVGAGASLFPRRASDLTTSCTCPDWANPCKHVAATHYVLGEAFDKDPFLLFELRGRTKEQVLEALRAARGGGASRGASTSRSGASAAAVQQETPAVHLGRLSTARYDAWREPPPVLHLSLERPAAPGALLRQLGAPPAWSEEVSPAELLAPMLQGASERALRLALAGTDPSEATKPSEPTTTTKRRRRRE